MIIDKKQKYTLDVEAAIEVLSSGGGVWGINNDTFRNTWENYNKGIYHIEKFRLKYNWSINVEDADKFNTDDLLNEETPVYIFFYKGRECVNNYFYRFKQLMPFLNLRSLYVQEEMEL